MPWVIANVQLCLSCILAVIISSFIAISGDYYTALFTFCISSVLISGWRSKSQDLLLISFLMFIFWCLNTVVYTVWGSDQIRLCYGAFFLSHGVIAITAFDKNQPWIAAIAALMSITAAIGALTAQFMPYTAIGNALFIMQTLAVAIISYNATPKESVKPRSVDGNVVKMEAAVRARSRPSFIRTR